MSGRAGSKNPLSDTLADDGPSDGPHSYSKTQCPTFSLSRQAYRG
jgi:hypothetical protein